ncbi:MAG: hypothetical protein ACYST0_14070 [Planctomycetota bacterium]
MLVTPLAAQQASYTYINQKAPYSNPKTPMLTALNLPKVGTTFKVQVPSNTVGGFGGGPWWYWRCYLALGVKNPNIPVPGLGGFLFTSADVVVPVNVVNQVGGVTMSFPIPNSPQLVGVRFYQQVLEVQTRSSTCALSRGGVGVIGK